VEWRAKNREQRAESKKELRRKPFKSKSRELRAKSRKLKGVQAQAF